MAEKPSAGGHQEGRISGAPESRPIVAEFQASAQTATAAAPGPTRPEGHPADRSPGWTDMGGRVPHESSASKWHKAANQRYAQHNAEVAKSETKDQRMPSPENGQGSSASNASGSTQENTQDKTAEPARLNEARERAAAARAAADKEKEKEAQMEQNRGRDDRQR